MPVVYTDSLSQRGRPTPRYADAGIDSTSDSDNGDSDGGAQQRASIHSRTRALSVSMMSAQTQGPRSDGRYHVDTLRAGRVTADDDDLDAKLARRGRRMSISVDRKKRDAAIASLGFTDQDLGPVSDGAALGSPTPNQLQLAAAPTSSPHCPRLSAGIANPSGGPTAASGISAAIAMRLLGALQKIRLERELDEMHLSISLKVTKTVVKLDSIGCPFVQVHARRPPGEGDLPCAGLRHDWVPLGPLANKPAVQRFCLVTETFALQVHFVKVSSRSRLL